MGFEPTRAFWTLPIFKTGAFNRSAIPPQRRTYTAFLLFGRGAKWGGVVKIDGTFCRKLAFQRLHCLPLVVRGMEVKIFDPCPLHGMLKSPPHGTVRLPLTVAKASYYAIPGLKPGASLLEIKQAYRDLVQIWHPDRFSNNTRLQKRAEEQIKVINAAYSQFINQGGSAIDTSSASEAFHTKRGPSQSYDSHQDQSWQHNRSCSQRKAGEPLCRIHLWVDLT